jgi:hypothetical protein
VDINLIAAVGGIVGATTGIVGVIVSFASYKHNTIEAINTYYSIVHTAEHTRKRRVIYKMPDSYDPKNLCGELENTIGYIASTFEHAAVLQRRRQLPRWFLSGEAGGLSIQKIYRKLAPYIDYRRKANPLYCKNFEWLCKKLEKSLRKKGVRL